MVGCGFLVVGEAGAISTTARRLHVHDTSVTEALVNDGALPQLSPSPEEMKRFVESEIVRWGKVVEQAGLAGSE